MSDPVFREYYDMYAKMVYNIALHYTQNREDAEEITQDVFVKVHGKLQQFRSEAQPKTWIYRIAVNASLDFLKAKQTVKRRGFLRVLRLDEPSVQQPVEISHPGIQMENAEAVEGIFKAIRQLPPNQQTAVILVKIEGVSQAEAAEIMEMSPKAVESLVQRAKQNLILILTKAKDNE